MSELREAAIAFGEAADAIQVDYTTSKRELETFLLARQTLRQALESDKPDLAKYQQLAKRSDYVSSTEVVVDLYNLIRECRIKRIPKDER